jgi:DNA-binding transcriptional MerR regulator
VGFRSHASATIPARSGIIRAMEGQGYSIRELARLAGIAPDTIREWIKRGLIPRVRFQGPKTRYSEVHLQRIRAVKRLKGESLSLDDIGIRMATMSPLELQNIVQPPVVAAPSPPAATSFPAENWKRVVLCPGLELHVADTAVHKRMAQQVYDDFHARQKE